MTLIGTLGESALHAALKAWYRRPGDLLETEVDGYVIDIVRGAQLIEIQTGNFTALKVKLARLLADHPVHVVYPVAQTKWIVRQTPHGDPISRRRSPRRGRPLDVFAELVRIPHLLPHPRLSLELLLTQQEEIWRPDGRGSWRRRGWRVCDRRLVAVAGQEQVRGQEGLLQLLPATLPHPFSNQELAEAGQIRLRLAQQTTYTLSRCGVLERAGSRGRAYLFAPA